jgi:hypothetical protein
MRYRFCQVFGLLALIGMTTCLTAEDKNTSDKGDLPGAFHPYNVTGPNEGTFHCVVCDHGLFPGALLFIRGTEPTDEVQALLKGLNTIAKSNEKARFAIFAVFLDPELPTSLTGDNKTDDRRQEITEKLRPIQKQEGYDHAIFALEAEKNLKAYNLGEKDAVTVVLFSKLKVVERFAFEKLEKKDVETVMAATREKLFPGKK